MPYGHMSLNWGPTEQPTREEMVGALEALSIGKHYALIVAHNDTEYPHVHVRFPSRRDPETGKVANRRRAPTPRASWKGSLAQVEARRRR